MPMPIDDHAEPGGALDRAWIAIPLGLAAAPFLHLAAKRARAAAAAIPSSRAARAGTSPG